MCFTNNGEILDKLRLLKRPITVWKRGEVNSRTGFVTTGGGIVVWEKGTIVKPHKICKPLKNLESAHAGLYFYTTKLPEWDDDMVRAIVEPKDVIGANSDGSTILAIAAKVTKAIVPNQRLVRLEWLKDRLATARSTDKYRTDRIEAWKLDHDERQEAIQQMKDEIAQLTKKRGK